MKHFNLSAQKKVIKPDDPIWRIEGIPSPTKEDLEWFENQKAEENPATQHMAFYRACHEYPWRVAKWMEYRRSLPADQKLDINHLLSFNTSHAPVFLAPFTREASQQDILTILKILTLEKAQPFDWPEERDDIFEKTLKQKDRRILKLLYEHNLLEKGKRKLAEYVLDQKGALPERIFWPAGKDPWNKLSETMISVVVKGNDGSSLKRIFDFAAQSVKTIERVPGEQPATFENSFRQVAEKDLDIAGLMLDMRGGSPAYISKKTTASPFVTKLEPRKD